MQWLWITLAHPDPATNGQLIYSKGLIDAVHGTGVRLRAVGLARDGGAVDCAASGGVRWHLADERSASRWRRLAGCLPELAQKGLPLACELGRALAARAWDAILFDSICAGWALAPVLAHLSTLAQPPRLVYLGHNDEGQAARTIARGSRGVVRMAKELDAFKIRRLERRLIAHCDLLTADAPEDCRTFSRRAPHKPVAFLAPGYGGARVLRRTIDASTPRRAVIVGSFDWPPKRLSLEGFLAAGAALLASQGIELQVVGQADAGYLAGLRRRHPTVAFIGGVDDIQPWLAGARIALVPDQLGGFKLKGLDYVFNRSPILALRGALPGMPLRDGGSIGLFDSHDGLVRGIVALIDDLPTLNRRQAAAFEACARAFDWSDRGRLLVEQVSRLNLANARSPTTARGRSRKAWLGGDALGEAR